MYLAFTSIPPGFDVTAYIVEKHHRLFDMGLDETHFDLVVQHLLETLKSMWIEPEVLDDIVKLLGPFREVFVRAGREEKLSGYMANIKQSKKGSKRSIVQPTKLRSKERTSEKPQRTSWSNKSNNDRGRISIDSTTTSRKAKNTLNKSKSVEKGMVSKMRAAMKTVIG